MVECNSGLRENDYEENDSCSFSAITHCLVFGVYFFLRESDYYIIHVFCSDVALNKADWQCVRTSVNQIFNYIPYILFFTLNGYT